MIARDSPWYAVDHGREHPNSELLRLSTAIPFHIKTAALMCMQIYPGVHIEAEVLYPPLTYLKFVRERRIKNSRGILVDVTPTFPS